MFKILALLAIFGAQQILADNRYIPLAFCEHYTGPDEYSDFVPTIKDCDKSSFSFHVMSSRSPNIQINDQPNYTGDHYQISLSNGKSYMRRRRNGQSYIVMSSASSPDLISSYRPIGVKVVSCLKAGKRHVDVFIDGADKPLLSGCDSEPIGFDYYSLASYMAPSEYFHKCTEPVACYQYKCVNDVLQAKLTRTTSFLTTTLTTAGISVNQVGKIVTGVVDGSNLAGTVGNVFDKSGNLASSIVNQVGRIVTGLTA